MRNGMGKDIRKIEKERNTIMCPDYGGGRCV